MDMERHRLAFAVTLHVPAGSRRRSNAVRPREQCGRHVWGHRRQPRQDPLRQHRHGELSRLHPCRSDGGDSWDWNTPPDLPASVSGTPGNQQVAVTWTAPGSGGSTITQYVVKASPGGASATVSGSPAPTSATVSGLTNGVAYTFTVVASN